MANITRVKVDILVNAVIVLNEVELRALDALFSYDRKEFLKTFYEKMGKAYLQPHEAGIESLHETIRRVTSPAIAEVEGVRKKVNEAIRNP